MFNIGPVELIVILIIALLVVGPKRLPEVGRSIGRGLREFRKAQEEVQRTIQSALDEEPPTSRPATPSAATPPPEGSGNGSGDPSNVAPEATGEADQNAPTGTSDIVRYLGKGLGELRRARDEITRSFRPDADDDHSE
jgi:sec-independent protein translocase protein TatA